MVAKINFRKDTIESLPIELKYYSVADAKTPNLRLFVFPSGLKTFFLYKKVNGRPLRITIGRYPQITIEQARNKAQTYNSKITLGENPHEERIAERREMTFGDLYDLYYHQYAKQHTKCAEENKKVLEYHFLPVHGNDKLSSITTDKMRALHGSISERRGKVVANRVVNMVSAVFAFGIKNRKFQKENPCLNVERNKRVSRDRFLHQSELTDFFNALKPEPISYQDYFYLLLFTGVRKSNQLAMRWDEIDLDLKRWRIPEDKTKNEDVNIVQLPAPAIEILKRRKIENDKIDKPSPFVFPGKGKKGHFADPKNPFRRIKSRMGVINLRIHDLRRTLGSYMAISGASLPIIGQALNHKSHVSTAIYARLSQDPIKDAVNKAVDMMLGKNIISLFRENMALFTSIFQRGSVRFSELLAA